MATVIQIVTRALRILRVADATEAPEAEDFETARVALNSMLRRWEASGLALGWNDVETTSEELPAPSEAEEAIVFNLALTLRSEYGASLDPDVIEIAASGLAALRRDVLSANPLEMRSRLPRLCRYNMITDQYETP